MNKSSIFLLGLLCTVALAQQEFTGMTVTGGHDRYSPTDVAGLSNWWSPESAFTQDTTGTNTVTQWNDLIGGKHLNSQPGKSTQATVTNTGTGYRAFGFDGINDTLTNNAVSLLLAGNDKPYSMFMVIRPYDAQNNAIIAFGSSTNTSANAVLFKPLQAGTSFRQTRTDQDGTAVNQSLTGSVSNGWNFFGYIFNGTRGTIMVNGVIAEAANNVASMNTDTFCVGAYNRNGSFAQAYHADVADIAFFGSAITTNELDSIYRYYSKPRYNTP